ncbi:MAG TPA: acyloxyacyl hydrolase [Planctomycetota bacterium]|nr:acyloxyacyl hydrolase [Planctomycetota bacterium]
MRAAIGLMVLVLGACHGGVHRDDRYQVVGDVIFGTPAGEFILSSTGADAPEVGVRLTGAAFTCDRLALIAAGGYHYYDPKTGPVDAVEFQVGARYYPPIDFHVGKVPVGPFLDVLGGVLHASSPFPAGGTESNLTAELGGGLEVILGKRASVLLGYHLRHLSNGGGNVPDNPGYNDNEFFLGFGWRW